VGVADGAGADEDGAVGFLEGRHGFKGVGVRQNGAEAAPAEITMQMRPQESF
jgi:hypothetical protein